MNFRHLLTKTVTIKRMSQDGGNAYTSTYQTIGTAKIYLEPQSAGDSVIADGVVGQIFMAFAEITSDIETGDQIIDGTTIYTVDGIEKFDQIGNNKHLEVTLRKMSK